MKRIAIAAVLLASLAAAQENGGSAGARVAAAKEVASQGAAAARKAIPELIPLGTGSAAERFAARGALVVAGPPAVVPLIEAASKNETLHLLLRGVSADLGAGVVAPALPLLGHEDPHVRTCAALALGAAGPGGEAAVRSLDRLLFDADEGVRRAAALALGEVGRGAHEAVSGLIHLANDPERGAVTQALLALGMIVRDAAERARRFPEPPASVARALDSGLAWLAARQEADGAWRDGKEDATAVVLLALLGDPDVARHDARIRAGVPHLVAASGPRRAAALYTAARLLDEPECVAAAGGIERSGPHDVGWCALAQLEAGFAGMPRPILLAPPGAGKAGPAEAALWLLAEHNDPGTIAGLGAVLERSARGADLDPESWLFVARARWYAGERSDELAGMIAGRQREDGSWDGSGHGTVFTTAVMLVCLETAAGLARPLELPLPDAPQLKAAVATLRLASKHEDRAVRDAATLALRGFTVP